MVRYLDNLKFSIGQLPNKGFLDSDAPPNDVAALPNVGMGTNR